VVRWPATLKVVGSPFHDSALTVHVGAQSVDCVVGVAGWNTKSLSGSNVSGSWFEGFGLRVGGWWLGTLLGPEETP
jgi:hypothetical protein